MQRIMNDPDNIVDEMLQGALKAHTDIIEKTENPRVIKAKEIPAGKVGVITGGGSGHKPAFIGYCGKNLCDAVAVGEICSSPTAAAFLDAARAADQGHGVACLYGNYSGDNMNVKMAVKMAKKQGITVKTVVANDDVASAPKDQREKRRGVAGEVLMWKVGGAKAAQGADLDEVIAAAQKAIDHTRSVGIGLTPCTLPLWGIRILKSKKELWKLESAITESRELKCVLLKPQTKWRSVWWILFCRIIRLFPVVKLLCWCPALEPLRSWSCMCCTTRLKSCWWKKAYRCTALM